MTPLDIAVANLIDKPELQPEAAKTTFKKLFELREKTMQIDKAAEESRRSMQQINAEQNKLAGAFDMLMSILEENMPKETIEQYGKEIGDFSHA